MKNFFGALKWTGKQLWNRTFLNFILGFLFLGFVLLIAPYVGIGLLAFITNPTFWIVIGCAVLLYIIVFSAVRNGSRRD